MEDYFSGRGEAPARWVGCAVLAALDPRDHRGGRPHTVREVLLGDAEAGSTHDHDPRELFERLESVLGLAVALAAGNALARVRATSADASSEWTRYLVQWTVGNHVRTAAALVAAVSLIIALHGN
jgi:hypothetical protein